MEHLGPGHIPAVLLLTSHVQLDLKISKVDSGQELESAVCFAVAMTTPESLMQHLGYGDGTKTGVHEQ